MSANLHLLTIECIGPGLFVADVNVCLPVFAVLNIGYAVNIKDSRVCPDACSII